MLMLVNWSIWNASCAPGHCLKGSICLPLGEAGRRVILLSYYFLSLYYYHRLCPDPRPHPHTHPHPDPHQDPHPLTRWEASAKASAAHVTSLVRGNVLQICAKREEGKGQPSTVGLHKKIRTNPGFDCKNSISEHIILFENILDFVTKKTLTRRCLDLFDKQYQVVR